MKSGGYYVAYGCNRRYRNKHAGCSNKEISKPYLEQLVLEQLAAYVFSDAYVDIAAQEYNAFLREQSGEDVTRYKAVQKERKAVERQIDRVVELLLHTQSNTLVHRLDDLEAQRAKLGLEQRRLEQSTAVEQVIRQEVAEVFRAIREKLVAGTLQNIRQVIDAYVVRIEVYPEQVVLVFHFFPKIKLPLDAKKESPPPASIGLSSCDVSAMC